MPALPKCSLASLLYGWCFPLGKKSWVYFYTWLLLSLPCERDTAPTYTPQLSLTHCLAVTSRLISSCKLLSLTSGKQREQENTKYFGICLLILQGRLCYDRFNGGEGNAIGVRKIFFFPLAVRSVDRAACGEAFTMAWAGLTHSLLPYTFHPTLYLHWLRVGKFLNLGGNNRISEIFFFLTILHVFCCLLCQYTFWQECLL